MRNIFSTKRSWVKSNWTVSCAVAQAFDFELCPIQWEWHTYGFKEKLGLQ